MLRGNSARKIAFLDRDGTLISEPPDTRQVDSIEKVEMLPGVVEGLRRLQEEGYVLVVISNQDGRGTSSFPEKAFQGAHQKFVDLLQEQGIEFGKILICPHFPKDNCVCRKPQTGLVEAFLKEGNVDLDRSIMVGDREADIEFANNLGIWGVRMATNGTFPRLATVSRRTDETNIFVQCNLDGVGTSRIESDLPFFNHMLAQLSKHSLIDLRVTAGAESDVDGHHTIEDIALTLGEAVSKALGERRGISRYGFLLPMDDALAEVALDLGGRPYLVFDCRFNHERIGDLPTEMVEHFCRSLAVRLEANIHVHLRHGRNEHHKIEAIFKGLGRALRMACEHDPRLGTSLPSTKGLL